MSEGFREFLVEKADGALIEVFESALGLARSSAQQTALVHLLDVLLAEKTVALRLGEAGIRAKASLTEIIAKLPTSQDSPQFAFDVGVLLEPSSVAARNFGADKVTPMCLAAATLAAEFEADADSVRAQELLRRSGVTLETLMPKLDDVSRVDFTFQSLGYGVDLTAQARHWDVCPLVGMERELTELVVTLASERDSAVLVGEPGIGKSALLYGLAYHIARKTRPLIPPHMDHWTIVGLSRVNLLAGAAARGELEQRLDDLLTFFRKNPTVVPFFDEIHTILDTEDQSSRTICNAIKPPMASGQFRCVGATTDKEYHRFIAGDDAMSARFTLIRLSEPDHATSAAIIKGALPSLLRGKAGEMGLHVEEEAVGTAVKITAKYQRNDRLPRKAVRLVSRAIAERLHTVLTSPAADNKSVRAKDIARTFSRQTGIPISELEEDRPNYFEDLADKLNLKVRGQTPAIAAITSWLSMHAMGWVDSRRPRGRFLFLGPPGVGKTHLAECLAEEVMRDRGSVVLRNMGEFKGEDARTAFMGARPGYLGFGQTSTIYSEVSVRPYSVVVLDEIEKAHPSLADLLLSILDGSAQDSQGRWVDFSQCVFIFTSNSIMSEAGPGFDEDQLRGTLLQLGGIWRQPLVDRLDRVVLFQALARGSLHQILDDQIAARACAAERPLPESISNPDVREKILDAAMGKDSTFSARRLERALLGWLGNHLSQD